MASRTRSAGAHSLSVSGAIRSTRRIPDKKTEPPSVPTPSAEVKPTAAEMLNGVPVTKSESTPPLFPPQALVLAGPLVVITGRQVDRCSKALLGFVDRGGEVAATHAELDGDIALAVLAVDHEGTLLQVHVRHLAQRHASPLRRGQQDIAN